MRLGRFHGRAIGPFLEPFEIDLDKIHGQLISVCGPNGSGKSTLIELMTSGLLFRRCATRGSLSGLAGSRDSYFEGTVTNGRAWTVRHDLDGVSGKSEASVLDAAGEEQLESRKVTGFDEFAASKFPLPDVLGASLFAAQKSRGFLEMTRGERLSVLEHACGIVETKRVAAEARARSAKASAAAQTLNARIKDVRDRGCDVAQAEAELEAATEAAGVAGIEAIRANSVLDEARSLAETIRAENADLDRALVAHDEAKSVLKIAQDRFDGLNARAAVTRTSVMDAESVRSAHERVQAIDLALAPLREELAKLNERLRGVVAKHGPAASALRRAEEALRQAKASQAVESGRLAERDRCLKETGEKIPMVEDMIVRHEAALDAAGRDLEDLRSKATEGAQERADKLRAALFFYAGVEQPGPRIATTALAFDDEILKDQVERPKAIADLLAKIAREKGGAQAARKVLEQLTTARARAEAIVPRTDLVAAEAEAKTMAAEAQAALHAAEDECVRLTARIDENTAGGAALLTERDELSAKASRLAEVATAEVLLAEIDAQLVGAAEALRIASESPALRPITAVRRVAPDVASAQALATNAALAHNSAGIRLMSAGNAATEAMQTAGKLTVLLHELRIEDDSVAEHTRLANDLDAIALNGVDAAGPRLTEIANNLLHTCHGSRFTVTIETQRLSSDGKRLLDGVEVTILDNEKGRDGPGDTFSPGEQVLPNEAIRMALCQEYCRTHHVDGCVLTRDETSSALDPIMSAAYVRMLRMGAIEIARESALPEGSVRVLFISHNPEMNSMADARIEVRDGKIVVTA
jgi:DNA repair protein SbcC/Rad50